VSGVSKIPQAISALQVFAIFSVVNSYVLMSFTFSLVSSQDINRKLIERINKIARFFIVTPYNLNTNSY
jgi:hypothetical protein